MLLRGRYRYSLDDILHHFAALSREKCKIHLSLCPFAAHRHPRRTVIVTGNEGQIPLSRQHFRHGGRMQGLYAADGIAVVFPCRKAESIGAIA